MMKKVLFLLVILSFCFAVYSQNVVQQAEQAFVEGKYSDATQLYEIAASTMFSNDVERKKLYDSANKCRDLAAIQIKAENAYKSKNYKSAMTFYNQIVELNPKDQLAKTRKNECAYAIKNAEEIAAWKIVTDCQNFADKVTNAREYLNKYPTGRYEKDATELIEEEELWQNAIMAKTYDAYINYIDNSKLNIYFDEAKIALDKIDDDLWASAKKKNTKGAYLEYITKQKDKEGKYLESARGFYNLTYARELYQQGRLDDAYEHYQNAKKYIAESDKPKMDKCLEYVLYSKACSSSGTIQDCKDYMNKYTWKTGDYFFKVEDKLMMLLCKEGKFDEAMKYANLKSEQKFVKKARKAWKKAHK